MIKLNNIYLKFKEHLLFENLNVDFCDPLTVIVGENGIGKTTLLKILLNILKPDKGDVDIAEHYKNDLFFSINRPIFYNEFTVLKNIKLLTFRKQNESKLDDFFQDFDLNLKIKNLSEGQKILLQLKIIEFINPKLIILDEPFANLDPVNQEKLKNFLIERQKSSKIIISTNFIYNLKDIIKKVYLIKDYHILEIINNNEDISELIIKELS